MTLLLVLVAGLTIAPLSLARLTAPTRCAPLSRARPAGRVEPLLEGLGEVRARMDALSGPRREVVAWMSADLDELLGALQRARAAHRPGRRTPRRGDLDRDLARAAYLVGDLLELTHPCGAVSSRVAVPTAAPPPFDLAFVDLRPPGAATPAAPDPSPELVR